ncbi:MAG: septal ring lytic transglycosylase RlpA family protein [Thiovulaceae bacterium]|nr:septal ring lytic transglycosylase RlpA family protein [Sulfurimonadaceae bacterium]MCW9026503.1 septal ring lytic transglycosylase RlpA family protein [Sulfurimonadaceae bacterium]
MNKFFFLFLVLISLFFSACSTRGKGVYRTYSEPKSYSYKKSAHSSKIDKKTYSHPTMKPYVIHGKRYYPSVVEVGDEYKGIASWYGPDFHGKLTSNGETYNMHDMTAAHKTFPMNTIVKVVNVENGLSTVVRINDRGPFVGTRIIDLSNAAAHKIAMVDKGTASVKLEVLGFQSKGSTTIESKEKLNTVPQESEVADYAIQIGSFSKFDGAIKTQQKYNGLDGYETVIKDINNGSSRAFKVWLKGFRSEKEARDYRASSEFQNSFIVRDN